MLRKNLSNDRHQLNRNFHHGSFLALERSLILGKSFIIGLIFVVRQDSSHVFFIPPWEDMLTRHFCHLRLRRYALNAFPRNS